jgi:hypothetical protein
VNVVPRLVSVFSIPDLGLLEEPVFYAAGFPVRLRLALFSLAGVFAALQAPLPLEARAALAAAGVALGAAPVKPPLGKLFARRQPQGERVYHAPLGSILVYLFVEEPGGLVVEVDGEEWDRVRVEPGLARVEVAGLSPGMHVVRLVLGGRVLRELRVYTGEERARAIKAEAEAGSEAGESQTP